MPTHNDSKHSTLVLEIEPELSRQIETAAAERGVSIKEYVSSVLKDSLERDEDRAPSEASIAWARLAIPSFSRDWESDADAVYDELE